MKKTIKESYEKDSSFWVDKTDGVSVMGDILGRIPSIELVDPKPNEKILDAGCGAGYISRGLSKRGAKVFGCDRSKEMLNGAIAKEKNDNLGINYNICDISKELPYEKSFFDKVVCIAVLIHSSPDELDSFLKESNKILKNNGLITISIMHPYLYYSESPNRQGLASWAEYKPYDKEDLSASMRFIEIYSKSDGSKFESIVWYHPTEFLIKSLIKNGFEITHEQNKYVTEESLKMINHSGPTNYPAFWQIQARKI